MSTRDDRFDSKTFTQHVGLKGHNSMNIFLEDADREKFMESINKACEKYEVDLLVCVLMSNHVHLILHGEIERFQYVFESLGASYARWFNRKYDLRGAFWEQRYYNQPIESREQFVRTAAYIFNNPVQAGMVLRPEEYEWSNFAELKRGFGEKHIRKFIDELVNLENLITYTNSSAEQKMSENEVQDLEFIERRRALDKELEAIVYEARTDNNAENSESEEEKNKNIVEKMWGLGANVFQISRVSRIASHFVKKIVEEI